MRDSRLSPQNIFLFVVVAALLGIIVLLTIAFFRALPAEEGSGIGLDWRQIYPVIENGKLDYSFGNYQIGMRNPPWSALLVLPLGFLSLRDSWAIITLITLAILIISVPKKVGKRGLFGIAIVLLVTSFPSLRHIADGNFEALVIGGVILMAYGYRKQNIWLTFLGALAATAKPQEVFLFIPVFGMWLLQTWQPRRWLPFVALVLAIVSVTMLWKGREFINAVTKIPDRGQLMDISLHSSLARIGLDNVVIVGLAFIVGIISVVLTRRARPRFDRDRAALLLAASMLASPYTAGNSYLTIIAIGLIPLFLRQPGLGLLLIMMCNSQYFFPTEFSFNYGGYFSTLLLCISWLVFAVRVWQDERQQRTQIAQPASG
jgi:hypothetical protein